MIIDTHAHVYPKTYLDEMERIGVDPATIKIARNLRASDEPEDMRARLEMMDKAGVDRQVLSLPPQLPTSIEAAVEAARVVRMGNDIYAGLIKEYPVRFLAYGAMPLPHVDESLAAIRYCLDTLGFQGMAANSMIGSCKNLDELIYPSNKLLAPIYDELNRRRAILYFHPTGCGACSPMVNSASLEWVTGAPIEDQLVILHLLRADIPSRYPDMRLHLAHLGGDIPFLAQRIQDNFEDWGSFKHSPGKICARSGWTPPIFTVHPCGWRWKPMARKSHVRQRLSLLPG